VDTQRCPILSPCSESRSGSVCVWQATVYAKIGSQLSAVFVLNTSLVGVALRIGGV
jgi:hypothetical protein